MLLSRGTAVTHTRRAIAALFLGLVARGVPAQTTYRVPQDRSTIQAAIDAAQNGDTVLVSPGTYAVNLGFEGKAITVTSGATSYNSSAAMNTILVPKDTTQPVVFFSYGETVDSVLNGFTITDPYAPARIQDPDAPGGFTILLGQFGAVTGGFNQSEATISNNRFVGDNGALFLQGIAAANYFAECSGPLVLSAAGYVHDNVVESNASYGPALSASGRVERNIIRNNTVVDAPSTGGLQGGVASVLMSTSYGEIVHNLVYGNTASVLLEVFDSPPVTYRQNVIAQNTFAANQVSPSCVGACTMTQLLLLKFSPFDGNGTLIANNIFQTSSPGPYIACANDDGSAVTLPGADTLSLDHNLFSSTAAPLYASSCRSQITNAGNRIGDPRFANPGANDFHLTAGSPALDAGNNSLIAEIAQLDNTLLQHYFASPGDAGASLTTDFDGNPSPLDATGLGYPVLDMGAYELQGTADGAPTSLLLAPSTYAPKVHVPVTFTAALSSTLGVPVGTVTLLQNGAPAGTGQALNDGTVAFALTFNTPGPVELLATYPGAYPFTPAQSAKLVLAPVIAQTFLSLKATPTTVQPGQPVSVHLHIYSEDGSYVPSPVAFTDNGGSLAPFLPDSSGQATAVLSNLAPGVHSLTATYAGDGYHQPASATVTVTVVQDDFAISLDPPTITVQVGHQASGSVLLTSLGIFSDPLALSFGTLPQYLTLTVTPASVQLTAGGTATSVLTLSTSALQPHAALEGAPGPKAILPVALATLLAFPFARRRRHKGVLFSVLGSLLLLGTMGCTDVRYPVNRLAPGTYTIPVTATDPATGVTHTSDLTVIATP